MSFHMIPQSPCPNKGKVTLVVFVGFLSGVSYLMPPQIYCVNGCIVAFLQFLFGVSFQMWPQTVCSERCIVALAAFVGFLFRVSFQKFLQISCVNRLHWLHCCSVSLRCEFSNSSSNLPTYSQLVGIRRMRKIMVISMMIMLIMRRICDRFWSGFLQRLYGCHT